MEQSFKTVHQYNIKTMPFDSVLRLNSSMNCFKKVKWNPTALSYSTNIKTAVVKIWC